MTTMVILAALLERILRLDPFSTLRMRPAIMQLKQMIENTDEDPNISHDQQGNSFNTIIRTCYDLEDRLELFNLEAASAGFFNCVFKRSSQKIELEIGMLYYMVLTDVRKLPANPPVTLTHHNGSRAGGRISRLASAIEDNVEMVGMDDAETELKSSLTNGTTSQLTLVSICGVSGIGKTTLARKLVQTQVIQQHFEVRAWVHVSDTYQTRDILQKILSGIISVRSAYRRDAGQMPQELLTKQIYNSLKGRRYLIVLDDVWSADTWYNLRMVLPDDRNGSKILITTETENVANQVGGARIHRLRCLTDDESWLLFRHKIRVDDTEVNPEIEQIGKEIAKQSRGLPLAINSLAGTLSGTPLHEWKLVLAQLHDTSSESSPHLFDVFNFSYKKLPLRLRPCFLYLGNFPDDAEIETNTICQLWIAEGLISMEDKRNNERKIMEVAERYILELDERRLVAIEQVVSGQRRFQSCRIHRLIRDFCKKKGREDELFEVIQWGDENQNATSVAVRRAIYLDKYECNHNHLYGNASYLRSLLFFNSSQSGSGKIRPREIPNLDQFTWLRVLYVYAVDFKHGKLPKGVEKLVYLRYLSFRECYLEELSSSVGNMFYLQTLDLRIRNECEMTIPYHVLDKLERLKYLYLPEIYQTHNQKKLCVGALKQLEILENFDTSRCYTEELLKLTSLKQLTITTEGDVSEIRKISDFIDRGWNLSCSKSLSIRGFDCHSKERFSVMENVFKSRALHTLGVEGYLGKLPKLDIKLPWKLTEILLNGSELSDDPMQILQNLPNLRILVLEVEAYTGEKMKCTSSGFPQLIYLKLSKLYKLEGWEVEEGAMKNLCSLLIENCKKLHLLPAGLQFITNLRKLEITSMPDEFVGRIQKSDGTEGEDLFKIVHAKQNVIVDGQLLILKERQQGNHGIGNALGKGGKKTEERHVNMSASALEGNCADMIYLT